MYSSRRVLVDFPRDAGKGCEATPRTSRDSYFLTVPFGQQSDSELPRGLATKWAEKRHLAQHASLGLQRLENREMSRSVIAHCQVRYVFSPADITMTGDYFLELVKSEDITVPPCGRQVNWDWKTRRCHCPTLWQASNLASETFVAGESLTLPLRFHSFLWILWERLQPTHNLREETLANPRVKPDVQWSCTAVAVVQMCLVAVTSLPSNEDFASLLIHHET